MPRVTQKGQVTIPHQLIVSEVVFAELGSQFKSLNGLTKFIRDTCIKLVLSNENSLFEASRAWKKYSERKKKYGFLSCLR